MNQLPTAVVADAPTAFRNHLVEALQQRGLEVKTTESGRDALAWTQKLCPQFLFVNAFLQEILGFEVIDGLMENRPPRLNIVLIGAIFRSYRYHAAPKNLYGADAYIEEGIKDKELKLVLDTLFHRLTLPEGAAPEKEEAGPTLTPLDEARTLARIIISDVFIYHPIRGRRAILKNRFWEAFADDLLFGENYFEKRFPSNQFGGRNLFKETVEEFIQLKKSDYERNQPG